MASKLKYFTDVLEDDSDEISDSQPLSLSSDDSLHSNRNAVAPENYFIASIVPHQIKRPAKGSGQCGEFRSIEEIDAKYRSVFSYPFFNLVQSRVIEDALYSDKSMVVCAPTGSGKTVVFEMAIVRLLMELECSNENDDFKIIYMAPVKALCTERLTEWYTKFTKLGLMCIEVTGDTDVDFSQLKPYRIIITTPEKWDMVTRRWRDHRQLVEVIKLFLIDEVHILNDETRGPVLEAVVSRMKTIETSVQSTHRIEKLQQQYSTEGNEGEPTKIGSVSPNIRFVAVSATVSNPEDVAAWLGTSDKPAVYHKFGDECRPVKLRRVVEGYPCTEGTSIFKFDIILNYKLWPIIQKYHNGKPTLIFCNTRKSVILTAETLSKELTITFNPEQNGRLQALASTIKTKKLQALVLNGVGCHHAGLLFEERTNIEQAFRNRDLPILITTTTLAMGVNLPAHLVIVKNTKQYVQGAYQDYSISTVLQMVGRAGRPQFDTEATAVIMTRLCDKPRYQALVGGSEPLQSYLHKRLPENLNSEAALGTVSDVAQCVQWLRSTFLCVRAAKDPKRYLGLPQAAPQHQISKKIEELCVKAMNGLASSGLITMDEACCIESTEAGRLMSIFYLDLETMKLIMKIEGSESLERLLWIICECHELAEMHLRIDERRCLNLLNRNNAAATIRFPMKGKITTRQMKLNCVIQAILGCLPIPDPSLNQEATKIMRIAERVCKCLVTYVTRPALVSQQPKYYSTVFNAITLGKCVAANLWDNSPFVSKQLRGIGPTFSTLLATAGKFNFMLLEESHPRDLERIMNKGAPAGNVLRKQISLLPKYQLTMTPIDEKTVSIQLNLLNQNFLAEHMEDLTAGTSHKSYVIIGDSENVLLLLTSFTDKDLICVYDGTITYRVTRKYGYEHKIFAHCVSSTFVGIDVQCEYVFQDIEPQMRQIQSEFIDEPIKRTAKQTTITDTFTERKRKNTDSEISQSKEKKKRESALLQKFKNMKESFGKTSRLLKEDLDTSAAMSTKILQELGHMKIHNESNCGNIVTEQKQKNIEPVKSSFFEKPTTYEINEADFIDGEFMDEDNFNNIMNEIECEMNTTNNHELPKSNFNVRADNNIEIQKNCVPTPINQKYATDINPYSHLNTFKTTRDIRKRGKNNISKKSNYNFIDLLEKNDDLSEEDEANVKKQNTFSDTIRVHIDKYLQKVNNNVKSPNKITDLIHSSEREKIKYTDIEITPRNKHSKNTIDDDVMKTSDANNEKTKRRKDAEMAYENSNTQLSSALGHAMEKTDVTIDGEIANVGNNKESNATGMGNFAEHTEASTKYFEPDKVLLITTPDANNSVNEQDEHQDLENIKFVLRHDVTSFAAIGVKKTDIDSIHCVQEQTAVNESPISTLTTKFDVGQDLPAVELSKNNNKEGGEPYNHNSTNDLCEQANSQIMLINNISSVSGPSTSMIAEIIEKQNPPIDPTRTSSEETTNYTSVSINTKCKILHDLKLEEKRELPARNEGTRIHTDEKIISAYKSPMRHDICFLPASQQHKYCVNEQLTPILSKNRQLLQIKNVLEPERPSSFANIPNNQKFYCNNSSTIGVQNHAKEEIEGKYQLAPTIYNQSERDVAEETRDFENIPSYYYTQQRSTNYSDTNDRNHYINNYSLSSNKIAVSTKETDDFVVRVTRKLRLQLDVTEIVDKVIKSTRNASEAVKVDLRPIDFDRPISIALPQCNEDNNTTLTTYSSEFEKEFSNDDNISTYQPNKGKPTSTALFNSEPNLKTNFTRAENKEELSEDTGDKEKPKTTDHKVDNSPDIMKPNNVESVLQKYSNMRNNNIRIADFSPSQTKRIEKVSSATKKEKVKRTFKISDINYYLDTPLPDTIIEKPKAVHSLEMNDKPTQIEQYKKYNQDLISQMLSNPTLKEQEVEKVDKNIIELDQNESILNVVEDISCEEYNEELEERDTNIDHTMFNPKTLLKCFGKGIPEVIPPPPEFCDLDETIDTETDNLTLSMDCYEPMMWNEEEKDTTFSEADQSIFEDDSKVDLSPSNEIETWNLTDDEGSCNAPRGLRPFSFTIMRKIREHTMQNAQYKNLPKTATLPMQNKLKQFKFNHKNKYIVRRK